MELGELLILLILFGLPLLELLGKVLKKRGGGEDEESAGVEDLPPSGRGASDTEDYLPVPKLPERVQVPDRLPVPDRMPVPTRMPRPERVEAGVGSKPVPADEPAEETAWDVFRKVEGALREEVPEAVRVYAPVVSLEPLVVDREREHLRLHQREKAPPPRARRRAAPALDASLRGKGDLRRAIILSEVLGPPKSLQ